MTKVLFSNPPWWDAQDASTGGHWRLGVRGGSRWPFTYVGRSAPDRFVWGDYLPYPFFMGYATTYAARETGAIVHLRDSIALRESYESYFRALTIGQYEYIFIESASPSWDHDRKVIVEIRRRLPDCKIVVTGPIAITQSAEILRTLPVYACVRGEYEKGCVRVLKGEEGVIEHDLLTLAEMNAAPFPYFDEVIAHRYSDANPVGQVFPHAQVWSSRGCPFKCIFCVWPATMTGNDPDGSRTRKVRHYTADYMEAFLKEIVARYKYKSIYFDDDTFNLGNSHVLGMCEVMKRIGLPWSAMCRADTIKQETWGVMRESGCFGVKLGFESGSQEVVDKIVNKHLDLTAARELVFELKRLGMTVHGTFTYGLPGETPEQMKQTREFARSMPLDSLQESGTAEIEGTPLSTLRSCGQLEKYEGARMDDNYVQGTDGAKKWGLLIDQLQNT